MANRKATPPWAVAEIPAILTYNYPDPDACEHDINGNGTTKSNGRAVGGPESSCCAIAASRMRIPTMPIAIPSPIAETSMPLFPSVRFFILLTLIVSRNPRL
jgi:hypothetical protein